MKGELLSVIEYLEKEKNLDKEIIIEAIEQALEVSARKTERLPPGLKVNIDSKTGGINAYSQLLVVADDEERNLENEEEETEAWWPLEKVKKYIPNAQVGQTVLIKHDVEKFGRISAQSAKQIIVQKIREAETEGILGEFTQRIGELVHGTVTKFEKGNIIIDIGKTMAALPKKEQSARERYKVGDRIRALVINVADLEDNGIAKVVLSRAQPALIRRLFEIEVPEIYDGIVEIKGIAREAGFRTKIAVISHDSKVDSVGACVGIRGSRIKNVVQEINNEKIDVVRWSDDIEKFIANSLQPVEVIRSFVDEAAERILVVVADDQISLAIGKSGQNIRLTSKLTEWKVDVIKESEANRVAEKHGVELETKRENSIFTEVDGSEIKKEPQITSEKTDSKKKRADNIFSPLDSLNIEVDNESTSSYLKDIDGISNKIIETLAQQNINTADELLATDKKLLLKTPGIGEKTLEKIFEAVKKQV